MANKINLRELVLNILLEIDKEGRDSIVIWSFGIPWKNISIWKKRNGLLSPGYARELWSIGSVWIISWTSFPQSRQIK